MSISVGDVLEINDVQVHLGQAVYNIYHYQMTEVGSLVDYVNIMGVFNTWIVNAVRTFQTTAVEHTRITIKNLTNGIDIYEYPQSEFGNITGDDEASFYALGFRLVRSTLITRHGSKRIGGIPEAAVSGNSLVSGFVGDVDNLADHMGLPLEVDSGGDYDFIAIPVIVGRFPYTSPDAGEIDLSRINPVSAAQFIRVTTQNSRKLGRGI